MLQLIELFLAKPVRISVEKIIMLLAKIEIKSTTEDEIKNKYLPRWNTL